MWRPGLSSVYFVFFFVAWVKTRREGLFSNRGSDLQVRHNSPSCTVASATEELILRSSQAFRLGLFCLRRSVFLTPLIQLPCIPPQNHPSHLLGLRARNLLIVHHPRQRHRQRSPPGLR